MHPIRCAVLVATLAAALSAGATVRGTTPEGIAYVSGGVGESEKSELRSQAGNYSFWLTTAALRSGAHLDGARVRIRDLDHHAVVLEHVMDGPWLFVALPVGRYEVEAILQFADLGRILIERGTTEIRAGDHHQMLLYFATGDAVADREPPAASGTR
jgi:hypothetical protein